MSESMHISPELLHVFFLNEVTNIENVRMFSFVLKSFSDHVVIVIQAVSACPPSISLADKLRTYLNYTVRGWNTPIDGA